MRYLVGNRFTAILAIFMLLFGASPMTAQSSGAGGVSAIIARARAGDLFAAVDPQAGYARHLRSGMICPFEPAQPANEIIIEESRLPRGDDVECVTRYKEIDSILTATRYRVPISEGEVLALARSKVRAIHPDLATFRGALPETTTGLPALVERLAYAQNGSRFFVRIGVIRRGDWIVTQTTYSPEAVASAANLYSSIVLQRATSAMSDPAHPGKA